MPLPSPQDGDRDRLSQFFRELRPQLSPEQQALLRRGFSQIKVRNGFQRLESADTGGLQEPRALQISSTGGGIPGVPGGGGPGPNGDDGSGIDGGDEDSGVGSGSGSGIGSGSGSGSGSGLFSGGSAYDGGSDTTSGLSGSGPLVDGGSLIGEDNTCDEVHFCQTQPVFYGCRGYCPATNGTGVLCACGQDVSCPLFNCTKCDSSCHPENCGTYQRYCCYDDGSWIQYQGQCCFCP